MEKSQDKKVFVNINQIWEKASLTSENEEKYYVKTKGGQEFGVDKKDNLVEEIKHKDQKFAYRDVKNKVESVYISYNKIEDNHKDSLVKGKEYLSVIPKVINGDLKTITKMIQMRFDSKLGSSIDTQFKRKEDIKLGEAQAYNHVFSEKEFKAMRFEDKQIVFQGSSKDGEAFNKIAYYEPKLQDIRTKAALSENTYFFGKKLTENQAKALNSGASTEIEIKNTKTGEVKTYEVKFSAKSESMKTKSLDAEKIASIDVTAETIKEESQKKNKNKGQTMSA